MSDKEVNTALSYSSSTLLHNCEQRYWHYKVAGTEKDSDFSDDYSAFDIGKTFHEVLELNLHTRTNLDKLLDASCKEYNTEQDKEMIRAMLHKYLDVHEASGLTCVKCELSISSEEVIGFIDAFMVDSKGGWYICDLKTAGRWMPSVLSKLPMDYQLNLYSHFTNSLAGALELDPTMFRGCLYRVTTKTKIAQKSNESDKAFFNRLYKAVKSYDIYVPKAVMDIEGTWKRHVEAFNRSKELRAGAVPVKNYSYCESYFRPCPYWSQCHKDINTSCVEKVFLNTAESYKENNKNIMEVL